MWNKFQISRSTSSNGLDSRWTGGPIKLVRFGSCLLVRPSPFLFPRLSNAHFEWKEIRERKSRKRNKRDKKENSGQSTSPKEEGSAKSKHEQITVSFFSSQIFIFNPSISPIIFSVGSLFLGPKKSGYLINNDCYINFNNSRISWTHYITSERPSLVHISMGYSVMDFLGMTTLKPVTKHPFRNETNEFQARNLINIKRENEKNYQHSPHN